MDVDICGRTVGEENKWKKNNHNISQNVYGFQNKL